MADGLWNMLEQRIRAGDIGGVVSLLERIDEPQRKAMAKQVRALAKELEPRDWGWRDGSRSERRVDAAQAAIFGTAGPKAARDAFWFPSGDEQERLVRARPRAWRDDWVRRACEDTDTGSWVFIRDLIRAGDASRPEGEAYVATAIGGYRTANFMRDRPVRGLSDTLRLDPEFLVEDVWELFASEQAAGWLAGEVPDRENAQWRVALAELAADGTLSRARLLDESLAALRRDFSPHAARWYHHLHEHLSPTPEERAARQAEYLALLSSADTAIVGFALKALGALEKVKRIDGPALIERIGPALLVPTKGHAARATKLLARTVRRDPLLAPRAVPALAEALLHEAREVQEAALGALERHRDALDPATAERVAELAGSVDPALRARTYALVSAGAPHPGGGGDDGGEAAVAGTAEPPPARSFDRLADPRLDGVARLAPILSLEAVLDRAAVLLERPGDADEIELVLDGIARHCAVAVDPGRAAALLERARAVEGDTWALDARASIAVAVLAWLAPADRRSFTVGAGSPLLAIAYRARAVGDVIAARHAGPLLATPTHAGGWIDPAAAVERVAAAGGGARELELAQLVLRLAPDGRADALAAARDLGGECAAILRHALGGDGERQCRLTRRGLAWDAAGQARDPETALAARLAPLEESVEPRWLSLRPVRRRLKAASPADHLDAEPADCDWGRRTGFDGELAAVSPLNRERLYALGVAQLSAGWSAGDPAALLTPLLDSREPFGPAALRLVALALGGPDDVVRATAADVLIAAFGDRRLDGGRLGAELGEILRRRPAAVPARWSGPLTDVAGAGYPHDVRRAAERVLAVAVDDDRRRVLGLVDVLRRTALECHAGVADPAARAFLEGLPPRSKGQKLAREALAVPVRA